MALAAVKRIYRYRRCQVVSFGKVILFGRLIEGEHLLGNENHFNVSDDVKRIVIVVSLKKLHSDQSGYGFVLNS